MHRPISDLLRTGGIIVYTAPETTVSDAVRKMAQHNVSSILVMENSRLLAGIFTERDLLRRVVMARLDPDTTPLRDVMTTEVLTVPGSTPLGEVRRIMRERHIRHIPVIDGDRLLGVVSLRDVLRYENLQMDFEIAQLKGYVMEKPYPSYPA